MIQLVTLDDFEDVPCEDVAPHSCEGRKRLKDELRVAANVWLLALRASVEASTGDYTDVENVEREAQIEWIKNFFNLEDDD